MKSGFIEVTTNAEKYITMFEEKNISIEKLISQFLNYSIINSICKRKNIKLLQFFAVEPLTLLFI